MRDANEVERRTFPVAGGEVELFVGGAGEAVVGAAHPADRFGGDTVKLLAEMAGARVVCVNGRGETFEEMVDGIEAARRGLGVPPWVFWGMSGGGWLALVYAQRHPEGLRGIVVESACACFRARLGDPACALSPFFPAWRGALEARGLLEAGSHDGPSSGEGCEWIEVEGVGQVFRRRGGAALVVSPGPIGEEMRARMGLFWTFDATAWLPRLRVPALVIAGGADPVVPVQRVRAVHEAIAGSSFVLVEGGGHVPTAARSPVVETAVRGFLSGLGAIS